MDEDTVDSDIVPLTPTHTQAECTGQRQSAGGRTFSLAVADAVTQAVPGTTLPTSFHCCGKPLAGPKRTNSKATANKPVAGNSKRSDARKAANGQ